MHLFSGVLANYSLTSIILILHVANVKMGARIRGQQKNENEWKKTRSKARIWNGVVNDFREDIFYDKRIFKEETIFRIKIT